MFIDKDSRAVLNEQEIESEDSDSEAIKSRSIGSIVAGKNHPKTQKLNRRRITDVLDLPSNKRTTEMIDKIMPMFQEFRAIQRIKEINAES